MTGKFLKMIIKEGKILI